MDEKSTKKQKKKKKINMNFDFSDDDSEDNVFQSHVLKPIKTKNNRVSVDNDHLKNTTIISSEYSRRHSQLPSFLEDIGPPVMDSTHLIVPENEKSREITQRMKVLEANSSDKVKLSVEKENVRPTIKKSKFKKSLFSDSFPDTVESDGNFSHEDRDKYVTTCTNGEKAESLDYTNSFVEVEVQDCSIQTSSIYKSHENSTSKIDKCSPSSKSDNKSITDIEASNASKSSGKSSSSSNYGQKDLFWTAIEDSKLDTGDKALQLPFSSQEREPPREDSNSLLSSELSTSPSPDPSSYYVKDVSLQASLSQTRFSESSNHLFSNSSKSQAISNSLDFHSNPQTLKDGIQIQIGNTQKLPVISGDYISCNSLREMVDIDSPKLVKTKSILAADSDDDVSPCGSSKNNSYHSLIIADSEDDGQSPQKSPEIKNKPEKEGVLSSNVFDRCDEEASNQNEGENLYKDSSMADLQDSGALCLRWSQTQEDSNKTSQVSGTSDEVDKVTSSLQSLSFHPGHSRSSRNRQDSSSSEDDHFDDFLNKLKAEQHKKKSVQRDNIPSMEDFIVNDNDASSSEDEGEVRQDDDGNDDDDDADGHLFYIKTDNELNRRDRESRRRHEKKTHVYHMPNSSESDSDLADFIVDDEKLDQDVRQEPRHVSKYLTDQEDRGRNGCVTPKHKPVAPSKDAGRKDKGKPRVTPSGKKQLLASSFTPAWGRDSDDDDDFVLEAKGSLTPSRFQSPFPGTSIFKTPKPVSKSSTQFETPVSTKGPQTHPWTAPRALKQPSKSGLETDDITFFLKSLSEDYAQHKRHPEAARFVKNFKSLKAELTTKLFRVFNDTIFESKIPSSIDLEWNARYRKTAGTFSYKRSNPSMGKITLSVKVCDRPERVRDTLVHELCHAAVRIINGANESHGPVWKSWARKVNAAYPFMPVVARCHDYIIHSKYTYQCVNCKYRIGRHSKSLDTEKKVCGHCKGEFQVFLTSELNASSSSSSSTSTPTTPRTPNRFAMFVKECYSEVKKRNADFKHGDIMKELSKEFAEKNKIQS